MTIKRSTIFKAAVICAAVVFAFTVVFTHLPRSMEFTVTGYLHEQTDDGYLPNYDKPYDMTFCLRRWERWLSGDVLEGSVQIGDKVYSSNNYLFWNYSPVDATELYRIHHAPDFQPMSESMAI